MAWVTPMTFVGGEVMAARFLNEIADNLRYLKGINQSTTIQNDCNLEKAGGSTLTLKNTSNSGFYAGVFQAVNSSGSLRGQIGVWIGGGFFLAGGGTNPAGYMAVWSETNIGGGARQIVPAGVTRFYYVRGVVYNTTSGVSQAFGSSNTAAAFVNIFSSGGDVLTVTPSAGALTVARTGGTSMYDVVMTVWYQ